jgi:CBS domain containing-hemolysin-like protein
LPDALLTTLPALLLIGIASSLSFVFALAESALFSLSPWQTKRMAEQAPRLKPLFNQLLDHPQDLLATIVLGTTVSNAIIGAVAILMVLRSEWIAWITFPSVGLLLLIGCELIPKTIAVRLPERWAITLLRPTAWIQRILRPIHLVAQRMNESILNTLIPTSVKRQTQTTDEDYQELVELGAQTGTLDKEEKEIILEIISLDEKTAGDVMTPKGQLATIPKGIDRKDMLQAATRHKHTRLLIQKEGGSQIIGILDAQSLILNPETEIESLMDLPTFIPESMNLWELFGNFQQDRKRIAIVLDEYGETAGIVTVEDILEEIMGPIFDLDERDKKRIERIGPDRWRVNGLTTIEEFAKEFSEIGTVDEIDTMGGLLATRLAHIPRSPVSVDFRGLRLTAETFGPRQIEELVVERLKNRGR